MSGWMAWTQVETDFVVKRPKSGIAAETVTADRLEGDPYELALDDGKQASRNSSAGGGHAVSFEDNTGTPAYNQRRKPV